MPEENTEKMENESLEIEATQEEIPQEKGLIYALHFSNAEGCALLYNALSRLTFKAEEYNEAAVVAATKQQLKKLLNQEQAK